jgi:hypothetical protein
MKGGAGKGGGNSRVKEQEAGKRSDSNKANDEWSVEKAISSLDREGEYQIYLVTLSHRF